MNKKLAIFAITYAITEATVCIVAKSVCQFVDKMEDMDPDTKRTTKAVLAFGIGGAIGCIGSKIAKSLINK